MSAFSQDFGMFPAIPGMGTVIYYQCFFYLIYLTPKMAIRAGYIVKLLSIHLFALHCLKFTLLIVFFKFSCITRSCEYQILSSKCFNVIGN